MPQILKNYDDLDWAEKNLEVDADSGLHTLALDGAEVELWLTDYHFQELVGRVNRYLKAGRPTKLPPGRKTATRSPGSGRTVTNPETKKIIAWVDEVGLKHYADPNRLAYKDGSRRVKITQWLRDRYYEAHPEESNGVGSDRASHPDAGDRG